MPANPWYQSDNWLVNLLNVNYYWPRALDLSIGGYPEGIKNSWPGLEARLTPELGFTRAGEYYVNFGRVSLGEVSELGSELTFVDGRRLRLPTALGGELRNMSAEGN